MSCIHNYYFLKKINPELLVLFMRKIYLLLLISISSFAYSKQTSQLKIDSGNKNEITVIQQGNDAPKRSDITIKRSNSNKVNVNQTMQNATSQKSKLTTLWNAISNINNVMGIIVSLITITGSSTWLIVRHKSGNRK